MLRHWSVVALAAIVIALMAAIPASAAPSSITAMRVQCHKEAGAYWNAGRQRWQYQGGIGTAQRQRFYDCLDRLVAKKK